VRVALTGGVGSGKSSVGALFAKLGAVVIDADAVAREVVEPGTPGLAAVADRFGADLVQDDGSLNRAALAGVVFSDPAALADLNAITHPLIRSRSEQLLDAVPVGEIAVYEIPLLAEGGPYRRDDFDVVVVVEAPMDVRLTRLAQRGLPPDQALARIAAQASDEERRALADELILNDATPDDLERRVEQVWARLRARLAQATPRDRG
jgi:dephospho-CoA kinase